MLADFGSLCESFLAAGKDVRFPVKGASMYPWIRKGDMVTVAPVGVKRLVVGDVVLYRRELELVALHTITGVEAEKRPPGYVIRGTMAFARPESVEQSDILGRVTDIRRGNRKVRLVRSRAERFLHSAVGFLAFLVWRARRLLEQRTAHARTGYCD